MMTVVACGGAAQPIAAPTTAPSTPARAAPAPTSQAAPVDQNTASAPGLLSPRPGQATVKYTDKDRFQYEVWIGSVTRPTSGYYADSPWIAPPGTSFVHVAVGLKNLQTDRSAPVPGNSSDYNVRGKLLPFLMHIPAAPGASATVVAGRDTSQPSGCSGYTGGHYGEYFRKEPGPGKSGCLSGMYFPYQTPQHYPWPPIPPGGSTLVEWETPPIAAGVPLSDLELVPNDGVTSSGSLPLQP